MRRSRTDPALVAALPHAHGRGAIAYAQVLVGAIAWCACGGQPATAVVPRCPTDRPIVVVRQAQVTELARCATVRGLTIRTGAALDTSALRTLATITGDLVIGPTVGIEEVTLGELRVVEGTLHVAGNGLMQGLFLPKLERAGRIEIDGNVAITTISLPRLVSVHGALRITDNASLELLDLSALASVDQELVITGDPMLSLVEAVQLQRAAAVQLDASKLPPDVADRLRSTAAAPR
jgi:hypothetical protein